MGMENSPASFVNKVLVPIEMVAKGNGSGFPFTTPLTIVFCADKKVSQKQRKKTFTALLFKRVFLIRISYLAEEAFNTLLTSYLNILPMGNSCFAISTLSAL